MSYDFINLLNLKNVTENNIFHKLLTHELNAKVDCYHDRFKHIVSDPNNFFIKRDETAGTVDSNIITLNNNIKVFDRCYCEDFTEILKINYGVHEPAEERAFDCVLDALKNNNKNNYTMIELGSSWAFYSIWFKIILSNSQSFCIEPSLHHLYAGVKNFQLNNVHGDFTQGFVGNEPDGLNLINFIKSKNIETIDILHSDIQGSEFLMLKQIKNYLLQKKINYIFVSTHSNQLHYDCIDFLINNNYRIVCHCDFDHQTYQFDGFILACPEDNNEISEFYLGDRSKSKIITEDKYTEFKNNR